MSQQEAAKKRSQVLKELREKRAGTVEKAQAYLKEQRAIRKRMNQVMKNGPMTVPEISAAVDLPADVVLWHVVAMKKYDLVTEIGQSGEYYQYALSEAKETKA